jgi:tetratricopeptide (TPR) repeat protein
VTKTKVGEAKEALERGEFERGLRLVEEAQAERPDDLEIRELYTTTHLARAIRLSDAAREARRLDLQRREIEYDQEFQDTPEAARAFELALAAIDDVLRVDPKQSKVLMLKAALVFRQDRDSGRPKALEILRQVAADEPGNRQVPFTMRKIERPCERCGDTGFCSRCLGRGERRVLGMKRRCEACYGRGICPVCGVL